MSTFVVVNTTFDVIKDGVKVVSLSSGDTTAVDGTMSHGFFSLEAAGTESFMRITATGPMSTDFDFLYIVSDQDLDLVFTLSDLATLQTIEIKAGIPFVLASDAAAGSGSDTIKWLGVQNNTANTANVEFFVIT